MEFGVAPVDVGQEKCKCCCQGWFDHAGALAYAGDPTGRGGASAGRRDGDCAVADFCVAVCGQDGIGQPEGSGWLQGGVYFGQRGDHLGHGELPADDAGG